MNNIENYNESIFESIKHKDENGVEYWKARELMKVLEYNEYRYFKPVIDKAILSCINSNLNALDHFVHVHDMIKLPKNATRKVDNYNLTRYACYLIVQNADPRKNVIALGKTYFAIQTRLQEISKEEYDMLSEDDKRLYRRKQTKDRNKVLYAIGKEKGVKDFDRFTNSGYKGLYNGETADDIAKRKGLRYREDILDNMSSAELGANVFRITQTEELLKKQGNSDEIKANETHYKVGKAIRNTIRLLGGTMPEDQPLPNKSIKDLENDKKKISNKK